MLLNPIQTDSGIPDVFSHSGLHNASLFNPPGVLAPSIKTFKDVVLRDLDLLPSKRTRSDRDMVKGLNSLCENKEIVIRPADKGGGKKDYLIEMSRILGDRDTYRPLLSDPKAKYRLALESLVQRGFEQGILNHTLPLAPSAPIIYYLPKIHKHPTCPPGHPVIGGIDSVASRVGRYIDFLLQPFVVKMPSYIKDSRQVINVLAEHTHKPGMWLVTADVTSLYTVIPHDLGLFAV